MNDPAGMSAETVMPCDRQGFMKTDGCRCLMGLLDNQGQGDRHALLGRPWLDYPHFHCLRPGDSDRVGNQPAPVPGP